MKYFKAEKCKDGWLVKITDTQIVFCESDVYKLAKQNGLKVKNLIVKSKNIDEVVKIYAE